jgi:Tetratricopeptide repeat/Transglycosylase SLT domain
MNQLLPIKIKSFASKAALLALFTLILFNNSFINAQNNAVQVSVIEKYVVGYADVTRMKFINDSILYREGWHTLPQPKFWQQIMRLTPDSALVSNAGSRMVLDKVCLKDWNQFSEIQKLVYKDSIRKKFGIADSTNLFVTGGKKDYYEFKRAMPYVNRSIDVFKQNNVDPWYAQAILLIECPGKTNTKSNVGANGPFQLMKAVAVKQGLKVNKQIDERTDIDRAAYAASRLISRICIPYTRTMLDSAHVPYNETDLWFRLLVLHSYHAGAGNVAGVIRKINPCEGGMQLIQKVWQTTYGGFKNASQNYSQLALAAFLNFDELTMSHSDSVYLIDGDRMYKNYLDCYCAPYDKCDYLSNCISMYEINLVEGIIPFDYFYTRVQSLERELSGIAPFLYPHSQEHYNDIGYKLLRARKTEDAFKVFKLNEIHFPESSAVYHGLGETYRQMGQKEQALHYYRKSLSINPANEESYKAMVRLNSK